MKPIFIFVFLFIMNSIYSQDTVQKFVVSGYISNLQSAMFDSINKSWSNENLLHNRINAKWYPFKNITLVAEMRNRLAWGDAITSNTSVESFSSDNGIVGLTWNVFSGKSYILNSSFDRLNIDWEKNKWKITLGRQRINWSQTLVWNPNDIFNTYSFFDFDYVERPGSDAIRLQYYNSEVSSTELAIKMNKGKKVTAAAYYKFNAFEYDFQFIGGILNNEDYVIGTGWSGAIKSVSFRGEISYFHLIKNSMRSSDEILTSIGADYTFGNSFMIMAEYLYSDVKTIDSLSFMNFYQAPQTVKNLSFVKHNFVLQLTCPVTPLLNAGLAGMFFPGIKGYYLGPSLTYSLAQNLDASFYFQSFTGEILNQKQRFNLAFLRLKFSF